MVTGQSRTILKSVLLFIHIVSMYNKINLIYNENTLVDIGINRIAQNNNRTIFSCCGKNICIEKKIINSINNQNTKLPIV